MKISLSTGVVAGDRPFPEPYHEALLEIDEYVMSLKLVFCSGEEKQAIKSFTREEQDKSGITKETIYAPATSVL